MTETHIVITRKWQSPDGEEFTLDLEGLAKVVERKGVVATSVQGLSIRQPTGGDNIHMLVSDALYEELKDWACEEILEAACDGGLRGGNGGSWNES